MVDDEDLAQRHPGPPLRGEVGVVAQGQPGEVGAAEQAEVLSLPLLVQGLPV